MMFKNVWWLADGHKGRTLQNVRHSIWVLEVAMVSAEGSGPPGSGPPGSGLSMKRLLEIVYPAFYSPSPLGEGIGGEALLERGMGVRL